MHRAIYRNTHRTISACLTAETARFVRPPTYASLVLHTQQPRNCRSVMTAHSLEQNSRTNGTSTHITQGSRTSLAEVCEQVHAKVQRFLALDDGSKRLRRVQEQTRISLRVIEEALERYTLDELSLSYNGGKDCLVLLILYLSGLHSYATQTNPVQPSSKSTQHHAPFRIPSTLPSVYIVSRHPFKEVDDFVDSTSQSYHLSLSRYSDSMKDAFTAYLRDYHKVRAIFVGTRRTDPHGATLKHFDPTDRGWPPFMRVHPVIDWHYAEVWLFIRTLDISYCPLYDLGYTSLGGTTDTFPNPKLKRDASDTSSQSEFRPAYELEEDEEERLGRPI